jgi:hypothetical protein
MKTKRIEEYAVASYSCQFLYLLLRSIRKLSKRDMNLKTSLLNLITIYLCILRDQVMTFKMDYHVRVQCECQLQFGFCSSSSRIPVLSTSTRDQIKDTLVAHGKMMFSQISLVLDELCV